MPRLSSLVTGAFLSSGTSGQVAIYGADGKLSGTSVITVAGAVATIGAAASTATQVVNGANLNLQTAATSSEFVLFKSGTDGTLRISGGSTAASGNIIFYGSANAKASTVEIRTSATVRMAVNGTGIGFFAVAPVAQAANIADATGGTEIATINAILALIEGYGLMAA